MHVKTKILATADIDEVKEDGGFKGYLSTYDTEFNGFEAAKGSFDRWHSESTKVPLFDNHNTWGSVLGHIYIWSDKKGLAMRGKFNLEVPQAIEKYANFKAGDFNTFSLGAEIIKGKYDARRDVYVCTELKVYEGSYTPLPANPEAVAVAASEGGKVEIEKLNEELRTKLRQILENIMVSLEQGVVPSVLLDQLISEEDEVEPISAMAEKLKKIVASIGG